MSRISLIACGESGALWDGKGPSIGVNDAWKFGKHTDILLTVNAFKSEPERQSIVANSRPKEFYSNLNFWKTHPNYKELVIRRFSGEVRFDKIYHSSTHMGTSPFIAISLAAHKGYKEIVLYGVDFTSHKTMHGNILEKEVKAYLKFITELGKFGVKVYLYSNYGAFQNKLPVWKNI